MVLRENKLSREDFYDEGFLFENFRLTFDEFFKTITDMSQWFDPVDDIAVKPAT